MIAICRDKTAGKIVEIQGNFKNTEEASKLVNTTFINVLLVIDDTEYEEISRDLYLWAESMSSNYTSLLFQLISYNKSKLASIYPNHVNIFNLYSNEDSFYELLHKRFS